MKKVFVRPSVMDNSSLSAENKYLPQQDKNYDRKQPLTLYDYEKVTCFILSHFAQLAGRLFMAASSRRNDRRRALRSRSEHQDRHCYLLAVGWNGLK